MTYYRDITRQKPTRTIPGCKTEIWEGIGQAEVVLRLPKALLEDILQEVITTNASPQAKLSWDGKEYDVEIFGARMETFDHTAAAGNEKIGKALVDLLGIRDSP
ncbi:MULTISPECIES: hypothetical protein [Pseudosulfitobacter]|uniref:hypothetical protein n=1 Tax=Pseudosulfitobacter pseudonitzschiae TaxID=1402135 RepID=UPI00116106B9|nr:hypothetical protein [Pseudosulfitobacter pseudonitzschiae]QKS10238.1 hypothetical protein HT745_17945 [Pseudosulfitobacter pseudonitzschiae]